MSGRVLGTIVALLVVATGLRAWNLDSQSIWFDEGFSWHAASQPSLIATAGGDLTNPPLYYLLLHVWIRLLGDSEFALRSLSLLQGILLLAVMGAAARRWFGPRATVFAVALGAFTPLLWWASQEARMYNTLALAVLAAVIGLARVLPGGRPARRAWLLLIAGETAALYTHNTGIVVLGAMNLVAGVAWLAAAARRRPAWAFARRWVGSQAIVLLLWAPEFLLRFHALSGANAATRTPPDLSPALLWQAWQGLWAGSWEMVRAGPEALTLVALLMPPLPAAGLASLRAPAGRLLWGAILALSVVLIAALSVLGVGYHARYSVMIAPLFLIAAGAGLASLAGRGRAGAVLSAAAVLLVAVAWLILPGRPDPAYQHDQAREMVAYYEQTLGPDDLVLTWSYAARYELLYYQQRLGLQAQIVTLPDGADAAQTASLINSHLPPGQTVRAEINTWYTQGSDRRGMLRCLIGHGRPAPEHTMSVQGMASTAYAISSPLAPPLLSSATVSFGPVTLTAAGLPVEALPASRGLCVPLEITVIDPIRDDLQAAVRLLNTHGQEVAAADTPVLTALQAGTRHLAPGETAMAYPLLYLPHGTPPGVYRATVRLYSADTPSGLDVLDPASGAPAGKDAEIGAVQVSDGAWPPFPAGCALPIAPGLTLANCASLAPAAPLYPGQSLPLTFAWQIDGDPPSITIALAGAGWRVEDTGTPPASGAVLDWREIVVPAEAAGRATLTAQVAGHGPVTVAEYAVEAADHIMTPPAAARRSGVRFPGVGTLYGFTVEEGPLHSGSPLTVTLVWQAEAATPTAYTVTVQLLDADGTLLAQHDSPPAEGSRPTTGWIEGEYIVDTHHLAFREERRGYTGAASLIVAVYDPATGDRIQTSSGTTEALLLGDVEIMAP